MEALIHLIGIAVHLVGTVLVAVPGTTLVVGTPFRSVPYQYAPSDQGAILQTTRFIVVFEGLNINGGGGGGGMTISGRHGFVPRFWDSYARGEHSGAEQRILPGGKVSDKVVHRVHFRHDYDPGYGMAKLEFYGHRFTVHTEGRKIRFKDTDLELPAESAVILVDREGEARLAPPERAKALRKKLDKQGVGIRASLPE
ncbi:MAG TPA: hypothetical protein VN688_23495 [Gemmataceae bacterium]|nr:hypothetical protein [Gemmataceae bacterium]